MIGTRTEMSARSEFGMLLANPIRDTAHALVEALGLEQKTAPGEIPAT